MSRSSHALALLSGLLLCTSCTANPDATSVDRPLRILERVAPNFPMDALQNGVSGWVVIEGTVGPDGRVNEARVTRARPKGWFEKEALRALRRWRFEPKVEGGEAVPAEFTQRINFELHNPNRYKRFLELVRKDRPAATDLAQRLAATCAPHYASANDPLNRSLRRLAYLTPDDSLQLAKDDFSAAATLSHLGSCLFTSWEHLRDPAVLELAAEFASRDEEAGKSVPQALRRLAELRKAEASPDAMAQEETYAARSWIYHRMVDGLEYVVDEAIAQRAVQVTPTPATDAKLAEARKLWHPKLPTRTYRVLREALAGDLLAVDRALLGLALGNYLMHGDRGAEALEALSAVADDTEAPYNVRDAARLLSAGLAARLDDVAAFDHHTAALAEQLGIADRLAL